MRQRNVCLLIFLLQLIAFSANARADYGTSLLFDSYIPGVDVGDFSTPLVYDWNSDGKKDLIVGSRIWEQTKYHGYVKYYENTGTNSSPSFISPSNIQTCTLTCSAIDVTAAG